MNVHHYHDEWASDTNDPTDTDAEIGTDSDIDTDTVTTTYAMGFGTGLANTLDNTAEWETGWGEPVITQTLIEGLAENGIKTVRLPVSWNTYAVDGVIQEDKMARVREVMGWILAADMYCIVDIHWDGGWINSEGTASAYQLTDEVRTLYSSYWQQIAGAFADVGERLLFESMNVVTFYVNGNSAGTPDYAPINELNQLFVTTVRAAGGANATRNLLISGFNAKIEDTCVNDLIVPTDPAGTGKLMLSVHYYTPYPFSQMTEPDTWEEVWTDPRTTWGTEADLAELKSLLGVAAAFGTARGLPVVVSEFAVTAGSGSYIRESDSRVLWLKSVMETALSLNMVPLLWDYGTDISRSDGSFSDDFSAAVSGIGK